MLLDQNDGKTRGKKVVIVGGVAGGASCAARLRRQREDLEIILLDRGKYVSFANCGPIDAGLVFLAIGVRPETTLARASGLQLGPKGGRALVLLRNGIARDVGRVKKGTLAIPGPSGL